MICPSRPSITRLEDLSDEILLLIGRYLSSIDILYSLYGLNTRLNGTISEIYRHLVVGSVSYERFTYICSSIIPRIGYNVCSLTVSDRSIEKLSKIFLQHFDQRISSIFPQLKCLTLIEVTNDVLSSFMDNLTDLKDLSQLHIYSLNRNNLDANGMQILLNKVLSANNSRFNSIRYDDESIPLTVIDHNNSPSYSNIKNLEIFLESLSDLHHLLTRLLQIQILHVSLQYESLEFNPTEEYPPVESLIQLNLISLGDSFNFNKLASVLKRIKNVEKLSIKIDHTYDVHLTDGNYFKSLLSCFHLKQFNYLVQYASESSINPKNILSTWKQFSSPFDCFIYDDQQSIILYSVPMHCSHLGISTRFFSNLSSIDNHFHQIRSLRLHEVPPKISELFPILTKCRRIKCLDFNGGDDQVDLSKLSKNEIHAMRFEHLTHLLLLQPSVDVKAFQELLQSSPNVFDLNIHSKPLHTLRDQPVICHVFGQQITNLSLYIISSDDIEQITTSMTRLSSIFKCLKHLYINVNMCNSISESLILSIFNQLAQWPCLISLEIFGVLEQYQESIRQWFLSNPPFNESKQFLTEYSKRRFQLWL